MIYEKHVNTLFQFIRKYLRQMACIRKEAECMTVYIQPRIQWYNVPRCSRFLFFGRIVIQNNASMTSLPANRYVIIIIKLNTAT